MAAAILATYVIGTTLGPYRIDRELGSGGMGTVYRATGPGGVVALKVIRPHLLADADTHALARFRRESEVGLSIRHPNVVATLAAGESDGRHWLALEYVEGQTLHRLRKELGTVPEALCRHVAHEIAAGLAAIHAAGIVHRDMKPENVLITRDNVVKVMDLGVARGAEDDARLTKTGAFVGSLQYAAPEQFTGGGKGLDGRADLHALGVLLYELATGVNPYEDADWRVVFHRVLKETPRPLGVVSPQVSPYFEEVVHTLLAKDRDARFASASQLADVLGAGEDSPWWAERARSIRRASRRPLRRIRIPRETALVGRDAEIADLRDAFDRAKAGDGQVVLVEGEAGIGKSRLVDEFVAMLQRDGEDIAFLYGGHPPGGAATANGAFTAAYREHFADESLEESLAACLKPSPALVPVFAALLRGEPTPQGAEPLTKDSLQTCFVHATRAIAAERVAVVLIDDLHFAPDEGRALFASLAIAVAGHRVLLVGTSRPPLDEKWIAGLVRGGRTKRLPVGRLGARDLLVLLKDALRSAHLAEELAGKIAEKTDGNPFFVFEVLRGLKDGRFLTQKPDGTWATTRVIAQIAIPASIADLIQARVGDLSEDERSLLEIAACAGHEFDAALVGDVAGLGRIPLLRTLGTIEKSHRLIRAAGRRYVFDHHQVQEHLYAGLSEFAREGYHAAVAESLERISGAASKDAGAVDGTVCADLCGHFLRGGLGDRAMRYFEPALVHLEGAWMNGAAAGLLERVLAAPELVVGVARAEICMRLAQRLQILGRREAERTAIEDSVALAEAAGDISLRARTQDLLGWHLASVSKAAEAEPALRAAIALAREAGDLRTEANATGHIGSIHHSQGRFAAARECAEQHLELARRLGDRRLEGEALGNLGLFCFVLGSHGEALDLMSRHETLAREAGHRRSEANAHGNRANVLGSLGRFAEAREHVERQLALARETGDRISESAATMNMGSVWNALGRSADALEHFERGLALTRETANVRSEALALVHIGRAHMALGAPAAGRASLEAALVLSREIGARPVEGYALLGLSECVVAAGDPDAALRLAEESLSLRRAIRHGNGVTDSLFVVARLRRRRGEIEAARAALDEAQRLAAAQGRSVDAAHALASLAALPGGDVAAALESVAAGGAEAASAEVRWHLWEATHDPVHLAVAKRLLDERLDKVPAKYHAAMRKNVPLHCEILEAAEAAGL